MNNFIDNKSQARKVKTNKTPKYFLVCEVQKKAMKTKGFRTSTLNRQR